MKRQNDRGIINREMDLSHQEVKEKMLDDTIKEEPSLVRMSDPNYIKLNNTYEINDNSKMN